jgi:hypothetical protein
MSNAVVVFGALALVGVAAGIASLCYLHAAPTGLSPWRNPVSQYGIVKERAGYRAATISLGFAGATLAVGIDVALAGRGRIVVSLLVVFAICRLIIGRFPMDTPGTPITPTGQIHGLIAVVTFGSVTIAAIRLGQVLANGIRWHALAPTSTGLGWAMAACIMTMLLTRAIPSLRRYFGAVERGLYVAIIAWLSVFAVACTLRLG